MNCRCGECGRFTGHWRLDESFCRREECWKDDKSPKALLCDTCKDALDDEVDGKQPWM